MALEDTLCLIDVWGEPCYQRQFEQMVHNHTVWENIHKDLVLRCPSIQDFGDWTKCKERLEYLRRKYRDILKNNKKTGSNPIKCPYFDELDAILCCRSMNNPGDMRMDNGGSSDEESDCGFYNLIRPSAEIMDYPSTVPGPPAPAAYQVHYPNDPPN
ncbi:hypothetical protein G5714_001842 [Onychostoma macrolepis]|uniref:Myb/SANT-like DNA-binding domain-containing protein n=1 Tax=Onychostoma macrolepis TaxID=369639 RepID=A0A7J6DDI5_9TELE|nr:hypothetical protein G5714_001842 [Onychostoma macrolepis]